MSPRAEGTRGPRRPAPRPPHGHGRPPRRGGPTREGRRGDGPGDGLRLRGRRGAAADDDGGPAVDRPLPLFPAAAALAAVLAVAFLASPASLAAQGPTRFPPPVEAENVVYDPALFDALEYRMIGPARGGRVTAVTGIPAEPYTFYMGGTGGGVWKTTDAGETWENVTDGQIAVGSIGDIKVAPSDPNVIYVGTGSAAARGNVSAGNGVYRSTDGGETWTHVGLPDAGQIGEMKIHPDDPDVVYVAALGHIFGPNPERGVFRTTDGGETWERVLAISDTTGVVDLAMHPTNPRILFAAAWRAERKPWTMISGAEEGGIYRTKDSGESWEKLGGGLPQGLVGKASVTVSPADPDRVWALLEAPDGKGGLYRSDDGGGSWSQINTHRKLQQRAWYYTYVDAHPTDPNTVYAMNTRLYRSVDGGKTFETIGVPHGDVHDIWIHPDDPEIIVNSNDGGANVSVNGGETWTTQRNQPTAEFYSVTVDNQFPYRVYGPQQDNSTISIPSVTPGGISPKQHWYSVGGCETGPIALDPDDPSVVYSGCYSGTFDRWERETGEARNLRVYPELMIGRAPKELKYRFQWNAPIEMSPHDSETLYHGSQFVHRTTDGGRTWETISPDLTTVEPEQIEAAGEPITHDETGVEVYPTVKAIQESPDEAGTIWAATNDGHVHLTRDGGGSWTEVTPSDMPEEGTVNRIELSPHRPGRAFLAVYRYRTDDFSPYVFRTDDYGESWSLLTDGRNGIPDGYPTRTVQEDPEREGLLYVGTEFGVFVSFDDGRHWQPLQLDLPATPVTDLEVHRGDLVVATQGRSFWILDDLSPLRQLTEEVARSERHLYTPRDAILHDLGGGFGGTWPETPPYGAILHYYFADSPEGEVRLEILDPEGELVRAFTGRAGDEEDDDGDPAADEPDLPVAAGTNRFAWDLRVPDVDQPDDVTIWGFTGGHRVAPGTYRAALSVGDWSDTVSFRIRKDPRLTEVTQSELEAQAEMAGRLHAELDAIYDALRKVRKVRKQVRDGLERAEDAGEAEGLEATADSLAAELSEIENEITQTKNQSHQDPLNFPPKLDADFASLYGYVADGSGTPPATAGERLEDLMARWRGLQERIEAAMRGARSFGETLEERGVPAVTTAGDRSEE